MAQVTIKQLLEAGVHFGHQTKRWNPKMKKFIFGERNGIYIINLEETLSCLEKALAFLQKVASEGKEILWVGTKTQARESVRDAASGCEMPYVTERWLGGMLTNFETVRKSVHRLDSIDKMEKEGGFQFITKKEVGSLKKEREKLQKVLTGIRNMKKIPGAIFSIDSKKEEIAVKEAIHLGIPVVSVIDTNCDPDMIDFPLPGNDDAIRAIKLFCDVVAQAIREGRTQFLDNAAREKAEAEAEEAAAALETENVEGEEIDVVLKEETPDIEAEKFAKQFAERKTPAEKVVKVRSKKPGR